ncbi:MAG TPA: hypothetical protein GXZ35_07995 [Acholeplasmataceae bacterium]|jgi:hypothetical protein|nr:hypothetical protein [Acholeplasmataceae bacterium]
MRTYDFHGSIEISEIDREIRHICHIESTAFKLLTGYGSSSGISRSKNAAMKSLAKIKREGLIKDYFSGDVLSELHSNTNSYEYQMKSKYKQRLKNDKDFGNDGIIFVFIK